MGWKRPRTESSGQQIISDLLTEALTSSSEGLLVLKWEGGDLTISLANISARLGLRLDEEKIDVYRYSKDQHLISPDLSGAVISFEHDDSNIHPSFWRAALESMNTKTAVKKKYDLHYNGGFHFIEVSFHPSRTDSYVFAHLTWFHHTYPMFEQRLLSVDEQQFAINLGNMSSTPSFMCLYDPRVSDILNIRHNPAYQKQFWQDRDIEGRFFGRDAGVTTEQVDWWSGRFCSMIGQRDTVKVENTVSLPTGGTHHTILEGRYIDSMDVRTGKYIYLDERSTDDQYVHRFMSIQHDVTKIKALEEENKASTELIRLQKAFLDTAPTPMTLIEPLPDGHAICRYLNSASQGIMDTMGIHNVQGKHSKDVGLSVETMKLYTDPIARLKAEGCKDIYQYIQYDPFFDRHFHLSVWELEDNRYGIHSLDLTELKVMEKKLEKSKIDLERQVKERDSALEVQSRFLSTMSHEIRTPLAGIMGALRHFQDASEDEESKEMSHIGHVCCTQLLKVIGDVLDFSKLEARHVTLDIESVPIHHLLEECMNVICIQTLEKNITLVNTLSLPITTFKIDGGKLKQVLINLLSNASKFTPNGGEIVMDVQLSERQDHKREMKISISDNGIGISAEQQEMIFRPFVQSDSSTTRKYGGTGLGLSISKMIVKLMGGDIRLESNLNEGSKFTISLEVDEIDGVNEEDIRLRSVCDQISLLAKNEDIRVAIVEPNQRQSLSLSHWMRSLNIKTIEGKTLSDIEPHLHEKVHIFIVDSKEEKTERYWDVRMRTILDEGGFAISSENPSAIGGMLPDDAFDKAHQIIGHDRLFTLRKPFQVTQLVNMLDRILLKSRRASVVVSKESEKKDLKRLSVMIAEDNVINQKMAIRMLKKLGIDPIVVSNGQLAVDWMEKGEKEVDIILMDINMPSMGGVEATHCIRKMKGRQPWIIALTADAIASHHDSYLNAGMDHVLTKPVDAERLSETILRYSERREMIIQRDMRDIMRDVMIVDGDGLLGFSRPFGKREHTIETSEDIEAADDARDAEVKPTTYSAQTNRQGILSLGMETLELAFCERHSSLSSFIDVTSSYVPPQYCYIHPKTSAGSVQERSACAMEGRKQHLPRPLGFYEDILVESSRFCLFLPEEPCSDNSLRNPVRIYYYQTSFRLDARLVFGRSSPVSARCRRSDPSTMHHFNANRKNQISHIFEEAVRKSIHETGKENKNQNA
ncbi:Signal transduction histidine kinase [Planoprotostelium fungivorum]|uniref:Signal transduction histidine kinase n=1 Tax=Planoprotostelium fungivorum TaxID=1890364 RepID=A0A2P6NSS5_9EUKA|nr:Signal transduction histidine kinase [Planoprotostelium fungivorum]